MIKIVIDTLGGDNGALPIISGTAEYIKSFGGIYPVFAGEKQIIDSVMAQYGIPEENYSVLETSEYIDNTQNPMLIFGGLDNTSMVLALEYLRDNSCAGLISAGNTGALLVGSICRLGLNKGLRRPALSSALPMINGGYICLVDCGANVDCASSDLLEFAKMGSAFMRCMYDIPSPRIGLLSTGSEKGKGDARTKEAYGLIADSGLNFVGNLEGNDLLFDKADVLVCDGFSGNVLLKNSEATGKMAAFLAREYLKTHSAELSQSTFEYLNNEFDYNSRGGAVFLGTKKTVIKMHGAANSSTAVSCIKQVVRLYENNFDEAMKSILS